MLVYIIHTTYGTYNMLSWIVGMRGNDVVL